VSLVAEDSILWRTDYTAARHEALKTGRPIFLDFGTSWCVPCKQLDNTTFRDPALRTLLNRQMIPVKIDGDREQRLVELLRIEVYPTLILASPEGKILKTVEGYVEAGRLRSQLEETLQKVGQPEWMMRAREQAEQAIAGKDFGRAIPLLRSIADEPGTRPAQVQARQVLQQIEEQARGELTQARKLTEQGQAKEATAVLTRLTKSYRGTAAAEEARQVVVPADPVEMQRQQRQRQAAEWLATAQRDLSNGQPGWCLDRCTAIAKTYGDLPEGAEAAKLIEQIMANPDWVKNACESLTERLGEMSLALAESWIKKGEPQLATECLHRLIDGLPRSRHAELARARLVQIEGRPASPVEYRR
jgi:thioredoxin-like negative regulator of GroEL